MLCCWHLQPFSLYLLLLWHQASLDEAPLFVVVWREAAPPALVLESALVPGFCWYEVLWALAMWNPYRYCLMTCVHTPSSHLFTR